MLQSIPDGLLTDVWVLVRASSWLKDAESKLELSALMATEENTVAKKMPGGPVSKAIHP
jgi:hypothetical protein